MTNEALQDQDRAQALDRLAAEEREYMLWMEEQGLIEGECRYCGECGPVDQDMHCCPEHRYAAWS